MAIKTGMKMPEPEVRRREVTEKEADLLELMPLIEMIWADGQAPDSELDLLDIYVHELTERLNAEHQAQVVDVPEVESFLLPYLRQRPAPKVLQTLRNIGIQRLLQKPDAEHRKQRLLAACLDIGSAAVKRYPYPPGERFSSEEKQAFFEILNTLEQAQQKKLSTV